MNPISIAHLSISGQMIQYAAWLVALVEFTLSFYVFILNLRHSSNRYVAFLLVWIGVNTWAIGEIVDQPVMIARDAGMFVALTSLKTQGLPKNDAS